MSRAAAPAVPRRAPPAGRWGRQEVVQAAGGPWTRRRTSRCTAAPGHAQETLAGRCGLRQGCTSRRRRLYGGPLACPTCLAPFPPCRSCYRDRLSKEPPPDEATQAKLLQVLGWLSKALQLLSLLLQHGGQMEAFLDDGGVMSLCLHLAKYPAIHAQLPPRRVAD